MTQLRHDALHSTIASVCGTAIEVWLCHGWSNGYFVIRHESMSESPLLYAAMAILVTHLRIPHFYFLHRAMHPWRVRTRTTKRRSFNHWHQYISNRSMACPMWASFCTGKSTVFITRVTTRLPSAGPACMWLRPPCTTRRGWCPSWSPGCTPWSPWPGSSIAQWGPGSDTTVFRYVAKALPRYRNSRAMSAVRAA